MLDTVASLLNPQREVGVHVFMEADVAQASLY